MRIREWLKAFILNTLFPPVCVSCKKEGEFLCPDCLAGLNGKKIAPLFYKPEKDPDFTFMDGVIYALDYAKNPQIQAAVKQLKYRFTQELAEHFGGLMSAKIMELQMVKEKKIILIPVPLHKNRMAYRGFNQSEIIAKAVSARLPAGKSEIMDLLVRVRETKQQAKLKKEERHANLKGAFVMKNVISQSDDCEAVTPVYFLVDDVCTTGSTLENCAQVLKDGGVKKVYGLVVARAFK